MDADPARERHGRVGAILTTLRPLSSTSSWGRFVGRPLRVGNSFGQGCSLSLLATGIYMAIWQRAVRAAPGIEADCFIDVSHFLSDSLARSRRFSPQQQFVALSAAGQVSDDSDSYTGQLASDAKSKTFTIIVPLRVFLRSAFLVRGVHRLDCVTVLRLLGPRCMAPP